MKSFKHKVVRSISCAWPSDVNTILSCFSVAYTGR